MARPEEPSLAGGAARVVAAGDLTCEHIQYRTPTECRDRYTAAIAGRLNPQAVLLLGDIAYETGLLQEFEREVRPGWGRFDQLIKPVPGNHEYNTPGAVGYFDYFNGLGQSTGSAGRRDEGYYSFDLHGWHILALNSNCEFIGGCGPGSRQYRWLEADLARHPGQCRLAFWHHPVRTSGQFKDAPADTGRMADIWKLLAGRGVDLVLNGHDHIYERFEQLDGHNKSSVLGTRQLTVGAGGKSLYQVDAVRATGSQRLDDADFGIVALNLNATSYEWQYVTEAGRIADAGRTACNEFAIGY